MIQQHWFIAGSHLYLYPPDPEEGDMEALKNWKPEKQSVWDTLKFRLRFRVWRFYAQSYDYEMPRKKKRKSLKSNLYSLAALIIGVIALLLFVAGYFIRSVRDRFKNNFKKKRK